MKQELFKEMYNEIQMDNQQKDRILDCLKKEEDKTKYKFHIPSFATICICTVLLAGVPVLAATTGVTERIIQAFNLLNIKETQITEEQKNIYLKYGNILDNEIELGYGTLKLEAVICDKSYICVPFSFQMPGNTEDSTYEHKMSIYQKIQEETILFSLADSKEYMGMFTVLPPDIHEDGTLKGCYLASVEKGLKKGGKISVIRKQNWKDSTQEKPVAKFKIGKIAESHNILLDKEIAGQNHIEISPLSLRIEGNNNNKNIFMKYLSCDFDGIIVKLKDGSVVQQASTGSWGVEDEDNSYTKTILFASPVNLDDVAGVHFQNNGEELWVDFQNGR